MLGKKHKAALSKTQMECMECRKIILSENQHLHIKKSHHNKAVKFEIFNDAKQPKLMFPVAKGDNPDNPKVQMLPELSKAIKILAVIPATLCSAERSFSSLRRLKHIYVIQWVRRDCLTLHYFTLKGIRPTK